MTDEEKAQEDELRDRCQAAGLELQAVTTETEDDSGQTVRSWHGWETKSTRGKFESGAHFRSAADVKVALATSFQDWLPIDGFEAIWSPAAGVVEGEVLLRSPSRVLSRLRDRRDPHPLMSLLWVHDPAAARKLKNAVDFDPWRVVIELETHLPDVTASLRLASPELLVWRTASPAIHTLNPAAQIAAIRIGGLELGSQKDARRELERIGNAAFLELDLRLDVPARLRTHYPWSVSFSNFQESPLRPLRSTPEPVPASLYLHARLSKQDPTARFLLFYQVLEYFFPSTSRAAAAARAHLALAGAVPEASVRLVVDELFKKRGVGSELEQFQQTLESVVSVSELRSFIKRELSFFYKDPAPPLVPCRVRTEESIGKLHSQVAKRLYKIRCRIVHKKEERDEDVLLPFADEVARLGPDLELLEFLARRAIVNTATPL